MGRAKTIEDEFEETLSLIDLPITPIRSVSAQETKSRFKIREQEIESQNRACFKTEEDAEQNSDFDFGSTRFEMSSADELFLHGQILPLRLSVDSKLPRVVNPGRSDYSSTSSSVEFTSSRSSSYSSSTSSVNSHNVVKTTSYQPKIRNQFHAHPSPTPRLRPRGSSNSNVGSIRSRKSSVWDVFRLGPVQPPGIELKDLKTRNVGNTNHIVKTRSTTGKNNSRNDRHLKNKTTLQQRMLGCRCSADAVENVQTRIVVMTSKERRSVSKEDDELNTKLEEAPRRRRDQEEVLPGRRTFEWLKQLSADGQVVKHDLKVKY